MRFGLEASLLLYAAALPVSMAATNFALGALLFFSLPMLRGAGGKALFPKSFLCLLAFLLWAGLTTSIAARAFEPSGLKAFSKAWNFFPYLLIAAGPWKRESLKRSFLVACGTAAAVAVLGALQYKFGLHYFFEGWFGADALVQQGRFYGFQSHPMHSGGLYAVLFLGAFALCLFDAGRAERPFWLAVASCLALAVLLTASRSYLLGATLGAGILSLRKGWKFFLGAAVLGGMLLAGAAAFDANVRQRLSTLDFRRTDESAKMRVFMWKSALRMAADHPLAGIGYRRWKSEVPAYAAATPQWRLDAASYGHAHNSYLNVAAETGWVGLAIFLGFWGWLVKEQAARLAASPPGSLAQALGWSSVAALACLFAAALFEHNLLTASVGLAAFFLIGLSRAEGARA